MAISLRNTGTFRAIASRMGMALMLVGAITAIGESQTPGGGAVPAQSSPALPNPAQSSPAQSNSAQPNSAQSSPAQRAPQPLPATQVSGLPTATDFPKVGASGDMIGFSHSDSSGTQTITLVHTRKSWMAVYHIDRSGTLRLVSSRPIDADFSLQLNATSPLPEEIRQIGRR